MGGENDRFDDWPINASDQAPSVELFWLKGRLAVDCDAKGGLAGDYRQAEMD
jgi:hypothetical protein